MTGYDAQGAVRHGASWAGMRLLSADKIMNRACGRTASALISHPNQHVNMVGAIARPIRRVVLQYSKWHKKSCCACAYGVRGEGTDGGVSRAQRMGRATYQKYLVCGSRPTEFQVDGHLQIVSGILAVNNFTDVGSGHIQRATQPVAVRIVYKSNVSFCYGSYCRHFVLLLLPFPFLKLSWRGSHRTCQEMLVVTNKLQQFTRRKPAATPRI